MYTVKISKNENISHLKDLIKEKSPLSLGQSLGHVDTKNFDLWQVSFPIDNLFSMTRTTVGPNLRSDMFLSDVFPSELDPHCIHVFVGQGELQYINSDLLLLINLSRHALSWLRATTICIQNPIYQRGRSSPGDILRPARVRSSFKGWESSNVSQQTSRGQLERVHTM